MPINFDEYNDNEFQSISEKLRILEMSNAEIQEWKEWAEEWIEKRDDETCTDIKHNSSE
jgi:hypothetical protein